MAERAHFISHSPVIVFCCFFFFSRSAVLSVVSEKQSISARRGPVGCVAKREIFHRLRTPFPSLWRHSINSSSSSTKRQYNFSHVLRFVFLSAGTWNYAHSNEVTTVTATDRRRRLHQAASIIEGDTCFSLVRKQMNWNKCAAIKRLIDVVERRGRR